MQETRATFLARKDPLEEEIATHSSILACKIPWTEEPFVTWGPKEDPLEEEMATYSSILAWKNPMGRGAQQATLHRVTKSQT